MTKIKNDPKGWALWEMLQNLPFSNPTFQASLLFVYNQIQLQSQGY
jgi:hypothetical protein